MLPSRGSTRASRSAAFVFMLGFALSPAVTADDAPFLVGGTQVHEKDHDRWVQALGAAGMNTVAVTVYARQGEWDGDDLDFPAEDDAVLAEIRAARAAGLAVVLVLRVAVDHAHLRNRFIWHGMIMPSSPERLRGWFERYGEFVTTWARIADAEGVDVLGIGSELNALNSTRPITRRGNLRNYYGYYWYQRLSRSRARRFADELEPRHLWVRGFENYPTLDSFLDARFEHTVSWARQAYLRDGPHTLRRINERRRLIDGHWRELISRTRQLYRGKLSYAANFDSYRDVGFWDALDLIGINAYFSLLPTVIEDLDDEAKLARFEQRWREVLGEMGAFQHELGLDERRVLFTEIGYTFRRHSTVEPWAHDGFSVVGWKGSHRRLVVWADQPVDYDERRMALEALQRAHPQSSTRLGGLLYWKLSTDPAHEAIEPFVVYIGADSPDRARDVLAGFGRGTALGPAARVQSTAAGGQP